MSNAAISAFASGRTRLDLKCSLIIVDPHVLERDHDFFPASEFLAQNLAYPQFQIQILVDLQ